MKMRNYSALQNGVVVRHGTFSDEQLLRQDMPAPEYDLVLDQLLPIPAPVPGYVEERRFAYPPLADFADALYWQSRGDGSRMAAYLTACDAVKAAYPKP